MKIATLVAIAVVLLPTHAEAASRFYLFEYSGTVRSTGGTVEDGSLLPYTPGDRVSGSFIVELPNKIAKGTAAVFYEESVSFFEFDSILAEGTQRSHSYFTIDATRGLLNAYKQVGTGTVYDNFEFILETSPSPFNDATVNLQRLDVDDFSERTFMLQRVDLAYSPVHFTEVRATVESLRVSRLSIRSSGRVTIALHSGLFGDTTAIQVERIASARVRKRSFHAFLRAREHSAVM
jgi:hypothetical protein